MKEAVYERNGENIAIISDPSNKRGAYHIHIGEDRFYLNGGTLSDFSSRTSTSDLQKILEEKLPKIGESMAKNGVDYKDLHLALFRERLGVEERDKRELERDKRDMQEEIYRSIIAEGNL